MSIGRFYVDGFSGHNQIFEFAGCMWHACEKCFRPDHVNPLAKLSYGELRRQFDDKIEVLKRTYGMKVEVMWECEWKVAKRSDPSVMAFMESYKHPERLRPCDGLFGGRTNAFKLYHKVSEGEKIRYVDFTSLYPFCQDRECYPVGHPQII